MALDMDVHELLVMGDPDLLIWQAQGEWETRDIKLIPYRQCMQDPSIRFRSIEFRYIPRFHNEPADALATLASMLPYPGNTHIDPLEIQVRNQLGYYNTIEAEPDGEPWYHDIKRFLKTREYPKHAKGDHKRTIRHLAGGFFLNREILHKMTPNLNLLRCIDSIKAKRIISEVHSGLCGSHMKGYVLTKKILQAGHLMKDVCEQFKIVHRYSTPYLPKANRAVEAANKNIKKILRKMIQGSKQWHKKLSFALLGYRTTARTSVVQLLICRYMEQKL
ncbi:uncharacterized protein [Nicotiana tomentosiformis]|uniref:uncharacterized protein n=1 Tax=Nicotiana tomentosiformis TaxID=4098 RepID=UPI00388CD639